MSTRRSIALSRMRFAWLSLFLLAGFHPRGAVSAEPSQLLPAAGLTFYLEYDGLNAHDAAWKASAAREILVGKSAGASMTRVERRLLDRVLKVGFRDGKLTGADLMAFQDLLVGRGFAFATYEDDGESSDVFVLKGFGGPGDLDRFESMLRTLIRMEANARFPDPTRLRNRDLRGFGHWQDDKPEEEPAPPVLNLFGGNRVNRSPKGLTWWMEGDALIVVKGPIANPLAFVLPNRENKDFRALHKARVSAVLDAIESKRPSVSTHPAYLASKAEGRDIPGFEPTGLFFAEGKDGQGVLEGLDGVLGRQPGVVDDITFFEVMGLTRADRIVGRWGFRGKSLLTDVRFDAPKPWDGLLGQLEPRGFPKGSIPPVPPGSGAFAVGPVSRLQALEELAPLRGAVKPGALTSLDTALQLIDETTTPKSRGDLLGRLGPTWCAYASSALSREGDGSALTSFLVGFDDAEKVDRALRALAAEVNADLAKRLADRADANAAGAEKPTLGLERLPAPDRGYRLVSSPGLIPWLTDNFQPTVLIGKSHLAVGLNLALAREAIAAESDAEARWKSTGEVARAFEGLPANLSFVSVGNPRDSSWPEAIVTLPTKAGPFLEKFLHIELGEAPQADRPSDLLDALGVPRSGPNPRRVDELRALIHPSVLAASVEERSFRVIALEALPLSCLGLEAHFEPKGNMDIKLKFGPGK